MFYLNFRCHSWSKHFLTWFWHVLTTQLWNHFSEAATECKTLATSPWGWSKARKSLGCAITHGLASHTLFDSNHGKDPRPSQLNTPHGWLLCHLNATNQTVSFGGPSSHCTGRNPTTVQTHLHTSYIHIYTYLTYRSEETRVDNYIPSILGQQQQQQHFIMDSQCKLVRCCWVCNSKVIFRWLQALRRLTCRLAKWEIEASFLLRWRGSTQWHSGCAAAIRQFKTVMCQGSEASTSMFASWMEFKL